MKKPIRFAIGIGSGLVTLAIAAAISAGEETRRLPEYWDAPAFALVDQTGAPFRRDDLLGSVWIASFVFTSCADVCPGITARMARLSDDLRRERVLGDHVRLVSFTVDPERDTPAVLRAYADGFGALPPAEWAFLTGPSGDAIRAMIQQGFRLTAIKPPPASAEPHDEHTAHDAPAAASYQVTHAPRVLLVDQAGTVRGIYDALDDESMSAIVGDALALLSPSSRTRR